MRVSFDTAYLHELIKHGVAYHDESDCLTFGLRFLDGPDLFEAADLHHSPCRVVGLHMLQGIPGSLGATFFSVSGLIIEYWNCSIIPACPASFFGDLLAGFRADPEPWKEVPPQALVLIDRMYAEARRFTEDVGIIPEEITERMREGLEYRARTSH